MTYIHAAGSQYEDLLDALRVARSRVRMNAKDADMYDPQSLMGFLRKLGTDSEVSRSRSRSRSRARALSLSLSLSLSLLSCSLALSLARARSLSLSLRALVLGCECVCGERGREGECV
jgi:hypothetical protein